jgi:hypothetical protein
LQQALEIIDIAAKIATVVVATIAFFALRSARQAVRAPVRPALDFVGFRVEADKIRISIKNVGAGPAIDATCRILRGRRTVQNPEAWGYLKIEESRGIDIELDDLEEGDTLTVELECKDVYWKKVKSPKRRFKVTRQEGYYNRLTHAVLFPEDRVSLF